MKTKTKITSRLLIKSLLFLLIAGALIVLPQVAFAAPDTTLTINITGPAAGTWFSTEQQFTVTFIVANTGTEGADNVTASISIDANATSVTPTAAGPWSIPAGGDADGYFTVECDGSGPTTITITVIATNAPTVSDNRTFNQEYKAHLSIIESDGAGAGQWTFNQATDNHQTMFSTCQHFDLKFRIWNSGQANATNVTVTIDPLDTNSEVDNLGAGVAYTTPDLGPVVGYGYMPVTVDMHCVAAGSTSILITPAGNDENTGQPIPDTDPDNIDEVTVTDINQELKAHLKVVESNYEGSGEWTWYDDPPQDIFSTCQYFDLMFIVYNTGDADAQNVYIEVDPGATAEVDGNGAGVPVDVWGPDTIAGGGNTGIITEEMHCVASGESNIVITPRGIDENTTVAIPDTDPEDNIEEADFNIYQENKAHLKVVESNYEGSGEWTWYEGSAQDIFSVCQPFELKFIVENTGEANAINVEVTVDPNDTAEVSGYTPGEAVVVWGPDTIAGETDTGVITVDMLCVASGPTTIDILPAGDDINTGKPIPDTDPDNIDEVTVNITQQTPPELWVTILSPLPWTHVGFCQEFAVTAEVYNSGEATATDVWLFLDIEDYASLVEGESDSKMATEPGQTTSGYITGYGTSDPVTWTLHCDEPGTSLITITPTGKDLNTGKIITYYGCGGLHEASIDVYQYEKAHLKVEITGYPGYPEEPIPISTCQDFDISAKVTNTGEPDAWDVEATISWSPADSVYLTGGTLTQHIGTIPGHGSPDNSAEVTWNLHCKQACYTTITVTASGYDEYGLGFSKVTKYYEGMVEARGGFIDAQIYLYGAMVHADGFFDGWLDGHFRGNITGDFDGYLNGYFDGRVDGTTHSGPVTGPLSALVDGYFDGYLYGYDPYAYFEGDVDGYFEGDANGEFTGNLAGTVYYEGGLYGSADVCFEGDAWGSLDGHFEGTVAGDVNAWVEGFLDGTYYESYYNGPFSGYFNGSIEGSYDGYVNGCFTGDFFDGGMFFYGYIYGGYVYVEGEVTEMVMTENPGAPIPDNDIEPASVTVLQIEKAHLVAEILKPVNGATFSVCQNFDVVAKVYNTGEVTAYEVYATIEPGPGARVLAPDPRQIVTEVGEDPGIITGNGYGEVVWIVHCVEPVQSTISVTPEGKDANTLIEIPAGNIEHDQIIVHQENPAVLNVYNVEASQYTVSVCQNFSVTAYVSNSGQADAIGVTATIDIVGGSASVVAPPPERQSLGTIPGGRTTMVGWTLHCEGAGTVTIEVDAEGTDENSGLMVTATPATIYVTQQAKAHLQASVDTDDPDNTVSTRQEFTVEATIANSGVANAENVTATIFIGANASLTSGETPTKDVGTISGGGGMGITSWRVQCNLPGPSTITVTPAGIDANTGEPIPEANIAPGSVTVIQEEKPHLVVEIMKPVNGATFSTCQDFDVVAKVYNKGEATAISLYVTIYPDVRVSVEDEDPGVPPTPIPVPFIYGGDYVEVDWDAHCEGPGQSTITVTVSGLDENTGVAIPPENIEHDQIIIHQEDAAELHVYDVAASQYTVSVCQNFSVTATVANFGEADAIGVNATIGITGNASVVLPPPQKQIIGTIPGGNRTVMVGWTLHCDGVGSVSIAVTAEGTDENSGALVTATPDTTMVTQEAKAHLQASVEESPTTVSTGQEFDVTFTVTNNGAADAENVTATISTDANSSLASTEPPQTPTKDVDPTSLGGGGGTGTVSWTLHCNLPGPTTITVTPAGYDTNTGEPIPSANTGPGSVTVIQEENAQLEVEILYPSNGDMFYKDDLFTLTAVVSNSGEADATVVTATIDPDTANDPDVYAAVVEPKTKPVASTLPGGETALVTWDLVAGTVDAYAIIKVEATGTGLGSATDYVIVEIDPPPYITLYAGANPIAYIDGATTVLPLALTNLITEDVFEIIWQRDESTGGEWERYYFYEGNPMGEIIELVKGHAYVIAVIADRTWWLAY